MSTPETNENINAETEEIDTCAITVASFNSSDAVSEACTWAIPSPLHVLRVLV